MGSLFSGFQELEDLASCDLYKNFKPILIVLLKHFLRRGFTNPCAERAAWPIGHYHTLSVRLNLEPEFLKTKVWATDVKKFGDLAEDDVLLVLETVYDPLFRRETIVAVMRNDSMILDLAAFEELSTHGMQFRNAFLACILKHGFIQTKVEGDFITLTEVTDGTSLE